MFLHFAANDPTPDLTEQQLEEAEADLGNASKFAKSGPYWQRIRAKLLSVSTSQDVDEAVQEWKFTDSWTQENGVCGLCGFHPIFYHFRIVNRLNQNTMVVGSECIENYLTIPGVPDLATLKRQLGQQRSKLKAMAEGRATEGDLGLLREAQEMARELNLLINKVAAPDKDLDVAELYDELSQVTIVGSGMGLKSDSWKAVAECSRSMARLKGYLKDEVGRRSKKYTYAKLLPAVASIMNYRGGPEDQIAALKRLRDHINQSFAIATASGIVRIAMEEVKNGRSEVLNALNAKLEDAKNECQKKYRDTLDYVKPYDHLYFMIQAGIDANKKQMDQAAAEARKLIESDDIFQTLQGAYWMVQRKISPTFVTTLSTGESRIEDAAFRTMQFIEATKGGSHYFNSLSASVRTAWKLQGPGGLRDMVGLRKAVLRAADDGIVNPEDGATAIGTFETLILRGNDKARSLIQEEVDDVKNAVKARAGQKVYEAMSEAWGFDVRKFFSVVPYDHPYFPNFCGQMLKSFMNGRMEPTFKERASIDKNLLKYNKPVPNSCWDKMESTLTKPYTPSYRR